MKDPTLFQIPQKIVVFRNDGQEVMLARRKGEQDFNGVYAFIGGKIEKEDGSILTGLKREKDEEIGAEAVLNICPHTSYNVYFIKHDGNHTIVPHYYAEFVDGEITTNDEYDDIQWVSCDELAAFEPKVHNIPEVVEWAIKLRTILEPADFEKI